MILVLAGTADGRIIAESIIDAGYPVLLSAVTEYAGQLANNIPSRIGRLDRLALTELVRQSSAVVDATHPFAAEITRNAIEVCEEVGVPYLRFERAKSTLPSSAILATNAEEAAARAVELAGGGTIFLTVGSKTLSVYLDAAGAAGCRVIARVLPTASVLAECERLGMKPHDIVAMKGPTDAAVDAALIQHFSARVVVTKESGEEGGVAEKAEAAAISGVPIIIVQRPQVIYPAVVSDIADVVPRLLEVCDGRL